GGIVRGGLCLPCDLREKNLYNYDPNAYSFNNSNYFPQSQDENYLCNLCGNNLHDGYDCQQQFLVVYEQEPSYNQNYDDNYYPHESLSFPCCGYCGGSHETFQCQPDNQNVNFSGYDQIQTLQYPDVNPPSPEIKYDQSTRTDRPIFLNDNEDHPVQNKESPENSSEETVQKQKMEDTIFELVKICQEKEILCIHDDVNDLIESALVSKLLLINSNSQHLDKKEQEIKNVAEQPAEHGNHSIQSLQNFKFPFVYEQEPSYNQNYDDNYYPHESLSFPYCDYYGYPDVNPPSPEISNEEIFQAKGDLMKTDRPIFLNDNEDHPVQNKESPENSSEETVVSKTNQEPPQDSDIHQLIEECSIEVLEEQKQKMEDTMFDLVKICHHKQFLCIHDDVDNLIESALDSKVLSINSINSQLLDKKEQEIKNIVEQPAGHRNRAEKSLQIFRVIHKSSISFKNTSQISSIHSIAPIQSTKEPEHLLSMGKYEVTLEDKIECDMPAKDVCSTVFTTFSNSLFKDNDDFVSSDEESLPDEDDPSEDFKIYSNPLCDEDEINSNKLDPHCFNVESDFVESLLNHDTFIDFSSKFDFFGEFAHIKPEIQKSNFDFEEEIYLIENLLYDNSFPRPPEELNAEIADTIIESIPLPIPVQDGNSQQEEIDIVTETDDVLPPSAENDDDDYDLLLGKTDLFLSDDSIRPGIENFADYPEGDIRFLEELLIDDSILSHESFDSNFEDNPSNSRPPLEPPDDNFDLEPEDYP
nr:hypothetical protein [Tanacetum cinerariifolium]